MSLFEALILGLVQGATEFLPISSSTHLQLVRWLLGLGENAGCQYFDLICHGGTVCAVILYLRRQIIEIFSSPRLIGLFSLAMAPLVPAYLLTKSFRHSLAHPSYAGYGLLITALVLWLASRREQEKSLPCQNLETLTESKAIFLESPDCRSKWRDVLCIGSMQALALMPGISRSASTIAAARFLGWSWKEAARFSFLLAVPSVLGGAFLETVQLAQQKGSGEIVLPWSVYLVGFLSAFGFGLLTIRFAFSLYERACVSPLVCYCAALGLLVLVLFHA